MSANFTTWGIKPPLKDKTFLFCIDKRMTKKCPICEQTKEIGAFFKTSNKIHSWCKECFLEKQKDRWKERKKEAVALAGGKCCKCGYNKNYAALEFHHLNPKDKEFSWSKLRQMSWRGIVRELKKCILLCSNCHRETHWPDDVLSEDGGSNSNPILNLEVQPTGVCPVCESSVYRTKYCSVECASLSKRKVKRPSKKILQDLLKKNSWTKVASTYGVSDSAVRKWAKQYDIIK